MFATAVDDLVDNSLNDDLAFPKVTKGKYALPEWAAGSDFYVFEFHRITHCVEYSRLNTVTVPGCTDHTPCAA